MKNYALIIASVSMLLTCFGCEPEAKKEEAKIDKITQTAIHLTDGTKIDFPKPEEKKSVIFISRCGQRDDQKGGMVSDLTPQGLAYAGRVKDLLKGAGVNSVLAIGTRFAQNTARPLADEIGTKIYTFNNIDYGPFLDYIYRIELGKRFMVVDLAAKIPEILYTFTAGETFDTIPDGAFNEIFVVFTSERGKAEVHRLKL